MLTSLYSAASGMESAERLHEVTARNLAYAHQPGYRRATYAQQSFGTPEERAAHEADPDRANDSSLRVDFTSGSLQRTERPLDFALSGDGFFTIEGPSGPLYTRNGSFQINADRELVTQDGLKVMGTGGPIVLPLTASVQDVSVSPDGTLTAGELPFGKLEIVRFDDPHQLLRAGVSLFQAPDDLKPVEADALVQQGALENSNVQPVEELVALITASRHYEAAQRAMQSSAEAVQRHINLQRGA